MKTKQRIIIVIFGLACCLLMSLLFVYSLNNFLEVLSNKGLSRQTLLVLPQWMRPFYKGVPSLTSLLCYCLFTLSAFLFLKEKNLKYKIISIISFIFLVGLFFFFF